MKKNFYKITTLVLIFILAISMTACSWFVQEGGGTNNNPSDLPSSQTGTSNIIFGVNDATEKKTATQIVYEVSRSVTAVTLETLDGAIGRASGVIVDIKKTDDKGNVVDGVNEIYLITCHHVIENMGKISVYVPDLENDNYGEDDYNADYKFEGIIGPQIYDDQAVTLVGSDKQTDIAVLKIKLDGIKVKPENIVKAKFPSANYSAVIGEDVIAIGNPAGVLPGTASFGKISYINRVASFSGAYEREVLQLNVDTYHGSSGGALFNMNGELIGITNGGSDEYSGINFAIPHVVNDITNAEDTGFINVARQLIASKTQDNYGYITGRMETFGFQVEERTTNNTKQVQVTAVTASSKAANAGMKVGDKILKAVVNSTGATDVANAETITSNTQLKNIMGSLQIGDTITLLLSRATYLGSNQITITMYAEQFIFCNTGVYPNVA